MNSGLRKVFVVGSIGTSVIFFQGSCSTIVAASGSKRMLNSRRVAFTYSAAKGLSGGGGLKLPPMKPCSFTNEENCGSSLEVIAMLVSGPAQMMLTWPGNSCTLRERKLT